ncbi:olfactory receptor 1361-like [Tachyglossus aculeatus]|uniref:olfactory receptor 1361-like n=1 Tax=Tachyglossus aculeatus TaxID=9261 RepID=UPI0018F485C8|nr:olfactory receptor 1361-like [Tachyglossus aculeatus]
MSHFQYVDVETLADQPDDLEARDVGLQVRTNDRKDSSCQAILQTIQCLVGTTARDTGTRAYILSLAWNALCTVIMPLQMFLVLLSLHLYHFPMEIRNQTSGSTLMLQSIANAGQQQLLFVFFLCLYLVTVGGNVLIVPAIRTDSRLHSPMYFFLANLYMVDIGFSSTTLPSLLGTLFTGCQDVPYRDCLAQIYFFIAFGATENFLLAAMAYDRYLAICNPLCYSLVMNPQHCVLLVVACWLFSHPHSLLHALLMTQMTFCASCEIPLYFHDILPLLKISCSDPHINFLVVYTEGATIVNNVLLMVLASYAHIITAVLRVPLAHGKRKAFSTCSSHLAAVGLFYGTVIWVYFQSSSNFSSERDTVATVIYTTITPLLNPFIYSLHNRDLHQALRSWPCKGKDAYPSTNHGCLQGSTFTLCLSVVWISVVDSLTVFVLTIVDIHTLGHLFLSTQSSQYPSI